MMAGPKHSTSKPSRAGNAVPLRTDEKGGPLVPNPVLDMAVKVSPGPQRTEEFVLCIRIHSLLPFTLQIVTSFMFPTTMHLKVKGSPRQVGGAAIICAVTSPVDKVIFIMYHYP